jgi:anti-sigma regulatory factor (Ser/Thr protein kinase)
MVSLAGGPGTRSRPRRARRARHADAGRNRGADRMGAESSGLTLMLVNQEREIERACGAAEAFVSNHGLSADVGYALALTLHEVIANVIGHGYEDSHEHVIRVRLWLDHDQLSLQVADDGVAVNPLLMPRPDLGLPIEQRPIGGLGIHIMRTMMDDLEYKRVNGQNILTLRKRVARIDPDTVA